MLFPDKFVVAIAFVMALAGTSRAAVPNHFDEPGIYPGRDYINQSYGEHIDPFNGNLELQYVDIFLPGNGGFDLKVQRSYNSNRASDGYSPFGRGWDIHFGRVEHAPGASPSCSSAATQSMTLVLPDGSRQPLYKSNGNLPGTTANSDYVTTQLWKAQCVTGGINVFAPNGTRYDMTEADTNAWHVTRITDRNGNWASFTYETAQIAGVPASARSVIHSVSTSDNRSIAMSYSLGRLSTILVLSRTWTYTVDTFPDNSARLSSVQPPAGSPWRYTYFGSLPSTAGSYALQRVTYPQGGDISYDYSFVAFLPGVDATRKWTVINSKTSADGTWSFHYSPGIAQYDLTTVTLPGILGSISYYHFGHGAVSSGSVWKIGLLYQKLTGQVQTETYDWQPVPISSEPLSREGYTRTDSLVNRAVPQKSVVSRDGNSFQTTYSNFDSYGNAQFVSETGNKSRSNTRSFFNNSSAWIIGFLKDENISGAKVIGRTFFPTGNLESETIDGVQTVFGYWSDGSLSSRRNARQYTTTFSDYYRGIARAESRPESVAIPRTVDDFGNVRTESDGEFVWGYDYDGLNRIQLIGPPVGNQIRIDWNSATTRTLSRGSYYETQYFDGYGRLDHSTRSLIGGNYKSYHYDALSRKTYESFPASGGGSTFTYDLLDRKTRIDSPHGTRSWNYSQNSMTDERNNSTTFSYDRYGDANDLYLTYIGTSVADTSVSMIRDEVGRLKSATQGGQTRTYSYQNGFLKWISDPETGLTVLEPDPVGNLKSQIVGSSSMVTFEYDGLNRMKSAFYGGPAGTVNFYYDGRGKLKQINSPAAIRNYDYDRNGNLTVDSLTIDGRSPFVVRGGPICLDSPTRIHPCNPGGFARLYAAAFISRSPKYAASGVRS